MLPVLSPGEVLAVVTWLGGCIWFASAQVSAVRALTARMEEVRDELVQMRADGAERSREIATIKARLEDIDVATRGYRRRFDDADRQQPRGFLGRPNRRPGPPDDKPA